MTIVAGFNMISGLLIMLFRNISTIGTLKSLGMTDKSIAKVFLRVASVIVFKGMLAGNAVALLLCGIQKWTHVLKLNPENYFVPLPVHLQGRSGSDCQDSIGFPRHPRSLLPAPALCPQAEPCISALCH